MAGDQRGDPAAGRRGTGCAAWRTVGPPRAVLPSAGGGRVRRARRRCCSTATARWSTTSPTTATRSGSAGAGRAGGAGPAARRRAAARRGDQPVRRRPAGSSPPRRSHAVQRPGRGAARPVRHLAGLPARRAGRLRLPQAGARAWCTRPPRALGIGPARCVVVGDIGADIDAARAAGAARHPGAHPGHPARRGRRRAGGRRRPARRGRPDHAATAAVRRPRPRRLRGGGTVLVVRSDAAGDVLVTGPAIRAVAASADRVICSAAPAAAPPPSSSPASTSIDRMAPALDRRPTPHPSTAHGIDRAHRPAHRRPAPTRPSSSPPSTSHRYPLALLLRMAGVPHISAISDDYPGTLLDVRHRVPAGIPEAERALSLAAAAGFPCPTATTALRLRRTRAAGRPRPTGPGRLRGPAPRSSVPARACPPELAAPRSSGAARRRRVPGAGHRRPGRAGAHRPGRRPPGGVDLGGRTDLAELAAVLAGAGCAGRRQHRPGPPGRGRRHAGGQPFAPTVPYGRWGPYRVPNVRLGDAGAPCRDTRATQLPGARASLPGRRSTPAEAVRPSRPRPLPS